jgi:hypothetical protein
MISGAFDCHGGEFLANATANGQTYAAPDPVLTVVVAPPRSRGQSLALAAALAILALLGAGLVGTILSAPLRHDEHLFVSNGLLFGEGGLYRDFGYNHLPNLPILLKGVTLATAGASPILVFRWVIVAAWAATAWVLARLTWRLTGSTGLACLTCLLLITNSLLGGEAGTLVSNNFLPVPFALAGLAIFIGETERPTPRFLRLVSAGFLLAAAAGLKANYLVVIAPFAAAAMLLPPTLPFQKRLLRVALPMLIGGIVGALPSLWAAASDPAVFIDHVFGYHRGPHLAWALGSHEPLIISLRDRFVLALSLWGSGSTLLSLVAIGAISAQLLSRGWRPDGRTWLVVALVAAGAIVAFVPRPSFPQYFVPPVPFALVLLVLLAAAQTGPERRALRPLFLSVAMLALAFDGPRLVSRLPALARPADWTGNIVHAISQQVAAAAQRGPVATLSPIYVLDAGGSIYPELAGGPFIYRVADLIDTEHRSLWRLVSPRTLAARLDAAPPGAILVGNEGALDDAFRAYATSRHFRQVPLVGGQTRYGALQLFVPTAQSISPSVPRTYGTSRLAARHDRRIP